MNELVNKSSSNTNNDDEEYKKMKQRILTIINQSIQDEIFYEQRFNVKTKFNYSMFYSIYSFSHVTLYLKHLLIFLVII